MGTTANTYFIDENDEVLCVLNRGFDGDPEIHGYEILEFLEGRRFVQGWSDEKDINGMGDLAVQLITHCKMQMLANGRLLPGTFYILPPENKVYFSAEWTYALSWWETFDGKQRVRIEIFEGEEKVLSGDVNSLRAYLNANFPQQKVEDPTRGFQIGNKVYVPKGCSVWNSKRQSVRQEPSARVVTLTNVTPDGNVHWKSWGSHFNSASAKDVEIFDEDS